MESQEKPVDANYETKMEAAIEAVLSRKSIRSAVKARNVNWANLSVRIDKLNEDARDANVGSSESRFTLVLANQAVLPNRVTCLAVCKTAWDSRQVSENRPSENSNFTPISIVIKLNRPTADICH